MIFLCFFLWFGYDLIYVFFSARFFFYDFVFASIYD